MYKLNTFRRDFWSVSSTIKYLQAKANILVDDLSGNLPTFNLITLVVLSQEEQESRKNHILKDIHTRDSLVMFAKIGENRDDYSLTDTSPPSLNLSARKLM